MTSHRRDMGRASGPMRPSNSLPELIDRLLDRGLVIDAWVRISLVGIEWIDIEARMVVASIDTYLNYAEAIAQTSQPAVRQDDGEPVPVGSTQDALTAYLNTYPESPSGHKPSAWYRISPN